ncbi:MAG: hypothetical protein FWD25_02875 [Clostridia bacterium]|nr:hypothetical protein [Clostridia bacterium]
MQAQLREAWAGRRVALCGVDKGLVRWTRVLLDGLNADVYAPESGLSGWSGGALKEMFSRQKGEVWICTGLPRAHTLVMAREVLALLSDSLATARAYGLRCVLLMLDDGAYRGGDAPWGCRENDPLGGRGVDGFSQSCMRLLAEGFRAGHWGEPLSVVIAHYGGSALTFGGPAQVWLDALARGETPLLPEQTMPFQHPLEVIGGGLLAASRALALPLHRGDTWNFGAPPQSWLSPRLALQALAEAAGLPSREVPSHGSGLTLLPLRLDSEKARRHLGWRAVYDAEDALRLLAAWHTHAQAHDPDAAYAMQTDAYLLELGRPQS